MPKKPNGAGGMQEYIPAGNGDASGEYGNSKGENKHFSSFKKGSSAKGTSGTNKSNTPKNYKKGTIANYKGYGIDYDIYGNGEFSVQYGGDDVFFDSEEEARAFIDKNTGNEASENNNDIFSSIDDFAKDYQLKKGITSQQAYDEMLKGKDIWDVLSVDGALDTELRDKVIDKMTKDLNLSKEDWAKVGITIYDNDNKTKPTNPKPKPAKQTPKAQKEKTGLNAFDKAGINWDENDIKEVNDYLNSNPDIKKQVEKRLRDEHKEARNYYPDDEAFNAMVDEDLEGQLASLNDMSSMRYLETLPRDRLVTAIEESIRNKNKSQKPLQYSRDYDGLDKEFDVATPQETANLMGRDVEDNGKLYKPQSKAKQVTYNGKKYDVDSTAYNGAIINAFGTSITDEKKQGLGGNGFTVDDGGDEIYFNTFDEAYNYAKKKERKRASNLFGVDL